MCRISHVLFVFPAAILFECVHTIYTIHPKSDLLEKAAKCIGKFVLSPKINLKYLGEFPPPHTSNEINAECLQFHFSNFLVSFFPPP